MKNRYYQPTNSKDAMRQVEKLFNTYCNAPLTQELLAYHQKLLNQMQTQILPAAKQEGISERVNSAHSMIQIMQRWSVLKLNGRPFNNQMHHFRLINPNNKVDFKRRNIKINGNGNMRSTRH